MAVKCQQIMEALEGLAPRYLAEEWDNTGLLVGSPQGTITKIMVALDVTEEVVEQAVAAGVDLIVAHHPVIFKPLTNLRSDLPLGRILARLQNTGIAVYCAHTNLDVAAGGVNDVLAEKIGLNDLKPLAESYAEPLVKLVVFVPEGHQEAVATAIAEAGAGFLGNYSHCSFRCGGTGTFLPHPGAAPFIGQPGKLERVGEIRLETILPEKLIKPVIRALLRAHPYEEVAYDLYPLLNKGKSLGLGRLGFLPRALPLAEFARHLKRALELETVQVAGPADKMINKVAVCGGSGAGLIMNAVFAGADVLVTGDIKYHEGQTASEHKLALINAGHFGTEWPVVNRLADRLKQWSEQNNWQVTITPANQEELFYYI